MPNRWQSGRLLLRRQRCLFSSQGIEIRRGFGGVLLVIVTSAPVASCVSISDMSWLNLLRRLPVSVREKNDCGALLRMLTQIQGRRIARIRTS